MITRDAVYTAIIENLETADGVQPRGYVKQLVVTGVDKSVDAVMKLLNFDSDGAYSELARRREELANARGEIDGLRWSLRQLVHKDTLL